MPQLNGFVDMPESARQEIEAQKLKEACKTGQPVLIECFMTDCNSSQEECNWDYIERYAMPDGTMQTYRNHCW